MDVEAYKAHQAKAEDERIARRRTRKPRTTSGVTKDEVVMTILEAMQDGYAIRSDDGGRTYSVAPISERTHTGLSFTQAAGFVRSLVAHREAE